MARTRHPIVQLTGALTRPLDNAWLAAFRVLFGLTMCASMVRFIARGWIDALLVGPSFQFHFKYYGFGWAEALPRSLTYMLCYALALLALCIALGLYSRLASFGFVIGFSYLQLMEAANYLNHYYLAILFGLLLGLSPAHRTFALDIVLHPASKVARAPALWLYLFRFQTGVVYTFAGLAKANGDWLLRAEPLRMWLASRSGLTIIGWPFQYSFVPLALSWASFLFESSVVWLLLMRRVRPYMFALLIAFHVLARVLFPIGMFSWLMILAALVFFPDDWPRAIAERFRHSTHAHDGTAAKLPTRHVQAMMLVYCVLQLLVPLRCFAYGGDVLWHEQGMRFSWRVMVREKNGSIIYQVHSKVLDQNWEVEPGRYLTPRQARELPGEPTLILALAHHIADDFNARGLGPVEVRVDALVSLNGRKSAALIDPGVDLANVEDTLTRASWITRAQRD